MTETTEKIAAELGITIIKLDTTDDLIAYYEALDQEAA